MSLHQHDTTAAPLFNYFQNVISWIKSYFLKYRKEMKGLPWGIFYNKYASNNYNPNELEKKIVELMIDDDVTSKKGIYEYLLSGNEKHLNIRKFTEAQKRSRYEKQNGICPICKKYFSIDKMEADHIIPWSEGGKTEPDNLQLLCRNCNRKKSNK